MNANFFALGMACVIFGLYNMIFVGGFFKTAFKLGRPFVIFIIACFLVIFTAESLHHIYIFQKMHRSSPRFSSRISLTNRNRVTNFRPKKFW